MAEAASPPSQGSRSQASDGDSSEAEEADAISGPEGSDGHLNAGDLDVADLAQEEDEDGGVETDDSDVQIIAQVSTLWAGMLLIGMRGPGTVIQGLGFGV